MGLVRTIVLVSLASAQAFVLPSAVVRTQQRVPRSSSLKAAISTAATPLLDAIAAAGSPVGVDTSEEAQARCQDMAQQLSREAASPSAAARIPLGGTYDLLYSMAKGGSNGKVGPFVGKVSQIILGEKAFINQVQLFGGFLTVQLHAEREVLDDERIRVSFVETVFIIGGVPLTRKPTDGKGVWKMLHVERGSEGSAALRVMETPSLFVLQQNDDPNVADSFPLTPEERAQYKSWLQMLQKK